MKKIRFLLALWVAKFAIMGLQLLRRNATHYPGVVALKICPDFLKMLQKPQTIIGVTGTNGKTTVANLTTDLLTHQGKKVLSNRMGGNILGGITTVLIRGVNVFGKSQYPMAVLEMDERSSRLVLPFVQPDFLLCTNLFRDSFKRNAHSGYIQNILRNGIPEKTKLILNADDLIACGLKKENACSYFGVAPLQEEEQITDNIIRDVNACPNCDHTLIYDFCRYNHVGQVHCPACGLTSPVADVQTLSVDKQAGTMQVKIGDNTHTFPLTGDNITDIYNTTAAIALLTELGFTADQIATSLKECGIVKSRFDQVQVGDKQVIMNLAKGQNPIACSRVFDYIRKTEGKKAVLILVDDYYDAAHSSENIAWLYEADFEFLNKEDIIQIVVGGVRSQDFKVRLLLAGVPEEKIAIFPKEIPSADLVDFEKAEKIFILYDVYTIHLAQGAKTRLIARMEGGEQNGH
jgi:UDP-N-acetylmuramyl tripeptide synthase